MIMAGFDFQLTRRKLLAGVGAIGATAAGAGAGTTAYFSDRERFEKNQLVAGSLDVQIAWQEHYSNWLDDDYGTDPPLGAETKFARMPESGETPDLRLVPGQNQPGGRPIELVFVDEPGPDEGYDSGPDVADGGR